MIDLIREKFNKQNFAVKSIIYIATVSVLMGGVVYIASKTQDSLDQQNEERIKQVETGWSDYAKNLSEQAYLMGRLEGCKDKECNIVLERYHLIRTQTDTYELKLRTETLDKKLVDEANFMNIH